MEFIFDSCKYKLLKRSTLKILGQLLNLSHKKTKNKKIHPGVQWNFQGEDLLLPMPHIFGKYGLCGFTFPRVGLPLGSL